jgi:hypothetical protein
MEYLDPKKHKAHLIRLAIGYVLIGVALILTTVILLYRAYGFGLKNGEVIQNGLIFVSSRPNPADMYVNGEKHDKTTNARVLMPAGQYTFELKRDGYRPWKRAINVEGGVVVRFDYPVLFPSKLTTTTAKQYAVRPTVTTQSPDKRWLLVQGAEAFNAFDVFDLASDDVTSETLTLPEGLFSLTTGTHRWKAVEWSTDNRHVLLQHLTDTDGQIASEYVLVDRENAAESVNLTKTLGANPTQLTLRDKKHDKYYLYSQQEGTLLTATLEEPEPQPFLQNVLAFKSHGDDVVLYATTQGSPEGKATVKLREDGQTYTIRHFTPTDKYLLELARYEDAWYIVAGVPAENRTYVYRNPAAALRKKPRSPLVPIQVLKAVNPAIVSFSDNARFIMAQGGQQLAVYDAETDKGYVYAKSQPIDAPQAHAVWMDGHRMMYVSGGKTHVFDFDNANSTTLSASDPSYTPYFDRSYKNLYTLHSQSAKAADGTETTQLVLSRTPLLTPQDQ